jgi:DNA-binding winged helix-turn-helix (wHTH) protein/tetratricopeptide (TPR) repeat protein
MTIHALGPFRLDTHSDLLFRGPEPLALGRRAITLLRALVERPGALVLKDALIEAAWPGQVVEDSNLTVQIAALRRVLGEAPGGDRWIETMPRRGYRFVGPVVTEVQKGVIEAPPQIESTPDPNATPRDDAERRQVTAMSCGLIDIAGRSDGADLEDQRETVGVFRDCVTEVVRRHRGSIVPHLGNTVLVLFGYPAAHEHDAEQAVRAGLELCAAVRSLRPDAHPPMRCRVGIATGMVIVGDVAGGDEGRNREIVGDTPDLAAWLQTSAPPDGVVIGPVTRKLIANLFDCRDLGAIEANGGAKAMRCWRVLGESIVASRFEALRGPVLSPLVGREEEIDLLLRRWARTKAGDGQIVLMSGEPGIGKSRIVAALAERLRGEPYLRLRYFCSPYHQDSALFPIIDQLGRASGFARDDPPATRLRKVVAVLARAVPPDDDMACIIDLLSLPLSERHPLPDLSPRRKKEKTLAALVRQLEGLARRQPVLVVFEDAHWSDPTSRELLDLAVERVRSLLVLLIVTFRPEFQAPWTGQPQVTMLTLSRLGRRDRTALIAQIAGDKALPDEVVAQIAERTDGVPLFVEELTKSVLEGGLLREERGRYVLETAISSLTIPTSLNFSLMARLDRLASVRRVAQIGAAIGRDFSYELLSAVSCLPGDQLQAALARLVASELVFQRGTPPDAVYSFKHALVQDAVHGSLLRNARRQLHAQIAIALETDYPEIIENQPELLAQHYAEAGLPEKAAGYWLRAGKIGVARDANVEAIAHLRRGIEAVGGFPDGATKDRLEFALQFALGPCLRATQGAHSNAAAATFTRARELCERLGDTPEYPHVMYWVAVNHMHRGEWPEALDGYMAALALAEADGNRPAAVNAMRGTGWALLLMGRLAEARRMLERSLVELDMCDEAESLAARAIGFEAGVAGMAMMGWTLWLLGYPDMAKDRVGAALQRAEAVGHPHSRAQASYYASVLHGLCREPTVAHTHAERCLALSEEHGFGVWRNRSRAVRGICANQLDPSSDSLATVSRELAELVGTGYQIYNTAHYALLSQTLLANQQPAAAREIIRKGLATAEQTSERLFEAELLRLKARTLVIEGGPGGLTDAQTLLEESLAVAQSQNARSLELRAAVDLARLHRDQGRCAEARDLLAPIYGWFTEGFDTPDLKDAKALLDELS